LNEAPAGRRGRRCGMFIAVRSRGSMGEIRQRFEEAAAERKFGVLGTHNIQATLNSKGFAFDRRLYIYEVCNPGAAKKVLDADIRIATALPCRVSIYEEGEAIVLETLRPTVLIRMFQAPALEGIAKEIETAIEEIMNEAAALPSP
jgi:uncharacterized protein (DUF302 family)